MRVIDFVECANAQSFSVILLLLSASMAVLNLIACSYLLILQVVQTILRVVRAKCITLRIERLNSVQFLTSNTYN